MGEALKPWLQKAPEGSAAFAIQMEISDLTDLALAAAREVGKSDESDIRSEVQHYCLCLIAAMMCADGQLSDAEQSFLKLLLNWSSGTEMTVRYVNQYAAEWAVMR